MNLRNATAVLIVVLAMSACVLASPSADAASVSADVCYYDAQGEVVTLHGTGDGVSSVISDAVSSAGLTVDLGPVNIRSFGGVDAPEGKAWTIQQWTPPYGWQVVNFRTGDAELRDGTTYFIHLSDVSTDQSYRTTYSSPDHEPVSTAYFFIRFIEDVNANDHVKALLDEDRRSEGFWISGTGSNAAWAFQDACERHGLELNMSNGIKGDTVDLEFVGWINSFLGLGDVNIGSGSYKYWSQFYHDGADWVFGETLGHYDPGVYSHYALVRQITTEEPSSADLGISVDDVPYGAMASGCTVIFRDGDSVLKTETVPYMGTATPPADPVRAPSGGFIHTFTGWQGVYSGLLGDSDVTAVFDSVRDPNQVVVDISGVECIVPVGSSDALAATVTPQGSVTWTSSDPSVASVSVDGVVTGVSAGTATVTATSGNGSDSIRVTVYSDVSELSGAVLTGSGDVFEHRVSAERAAVLTASGKGFTLSVPFAVISLSTSSLTALSGTDGSILSIERCVSGDLTAAQSLIIGDSQAYRFLVDGAGVSDLGGTATISVAYQGSFTAPTVYHVADDGATEAIGCTVSGGMATFQTDHLSVFFVSEGPSDTVPPSDGGSDWTIPLIAAVAIALCVAAGIVMMRRRSV